MKWRRRGNPEGKSAEGRERRGGGIVWIPNMCPGNPKWGQMAQASLFGNHSIRRRDAWQKVAGNSAGVSSWCWTLPGAVPSIPLNKRASPHNCAASLLNAAVDFKRSAIPSCPKPPEFETYVIRPDENTVPIMCHRAPRMDICVLFQLQLSSRTISFDSLAEPTCGSYVTRPERGAAALRGACRASMLRRRPKHNMMAANYISVSFRRQMSNITWLALIGRFLNE